MAGCPQTLVDIALSYAPSDYPSAQYLEGVLPYDTPAFQEATGQPYPKGMSSCAIFQLANYARAGFTGEGIGVPYEKYVGQAEALLVKFGQSRGALESNPDPNTFIPGDVFHVDNISHWGMVVEVPGDGTVISVDGGQPGIAVRTRNIVRSGNRWALQSAGGAVRPLLHVIRAEALDVPCTPLYRGWLGYAAFLIAFAGSAFAAKYLLT